MKEILSIMLLFSLLACGKSGGGGGGGAPSEEALDSDISEVTPPATGGGSSSGSNGSSSSVPAKALSFKTNVKYLSGFNSSQKTKYNRAVAMVKKVVATEAFRRQILNHKYNGKKSFASTTKTNSQVYQDILDAAEKLTPAKNNRLDVGVKLYYANNSVVGYTNPSITYFNVNTKFFNNYSTNEVAGNLFHEWLHKVGYGHDSEATARRPYSVPYAVGYMIRDIGKNFL